MHKLPDDINKLIASFHGKADEARALARALAWHDIRLNYEAIADCYEQLAQSAGELARLRLDYGGTAGVATTIAVSPSSVPRQTWRKGVEDRIALPAHYQKLTTKCPSKAPYWPRNAARRPETSQGLPPTRASRAVPGGQVVVEWPKGRTQHRRPPGRGPRDAAQRAGTGLVEGHRLEPRLRSSSTGERLRR